MLTPLHHRPDTQWDGSVGTPTADAEAVIEAGGVLVFPHLAFDLLPGERKFLDPAYADAKAKNISLRANDALRGAARRCTRLQNTTSCAR